MKQISAFKIGDIIITKQYHTAYGRISEIIDFEHYEVTVLLRDSINDMWYKSDVKRVINAGDIELPKNPQYVNSIRRDLDNETTSSAIERWLS